ncbi:HepT-like ribonuclease domain-containing protein [Sphingobium sp. AN558]|uniref:HepT-like ribonuclease domain-containing protein n=1 Tax=Sphingobium sp. AN558 TaxID=3133442 RepID=UPI0030BA3ABD
MLPEERDLAVLQTILLLIERIRAHMGKVSAVSFVESDDDIDLLAYRLSMIGEYANKLSERLRERHAHMPWTAMTGLRNIVAHQYRRVTPSRLWDTAANDLGSLEQLCVEEIKSLES